MTTQEFITQMVQRGLPEDGVVREDMSFVVDEVSVRHIVVRSFSHPEITFELDIRRPAERSYALSSVSDREHHVTINLTPDDFK